MEEFSMELELSTLDMQNIFGSNDQYIKKIEKNLNVIIVDRNGAVKISGEKDSVNTAANIIKQLTGVSKNGSRIEEQNVDYAIELGRDHNEDAIGEMDSEIICHAINGKPIKPKTLGQKAYIDAIKENMIVFGIGPA